MRPRCFMAMPNFVTTGVRRSRTSDTGRIAA
jgi:hypothetical protein